MATQRITRTTTAARKLATSGTKATAPLVLRREATMQPPAHEDVARRAYELFQERGGAHGHHLEDWYQAMTELSGR